MTIIEKQYKKGLYKLFINKADRYEIIYFPFYYKEQTKSLGQFNDLEQAKHYFEELTNDTN